MRHDALTPIGTSRSTPSAPSPTPAIAFSRVSKTFGAHCAVRDISFTVAPGEFFSLLGPSGCGKTTTLRMVAGFEHPDADGGEVRLDGKRVNNLRPYARDLGMVFQSYALFPHLSVERNIAFGLEQRGCSRTTIAERVRKAMEVVRLDIAQFARRLPAELSGGQRQRVALARALVVEPPILLLDEPLGALDLKLRKEMQLELKALNRRLGITFLYVTHDQEEALTMSDRIAVMDNSRIAQIGPPAEIYERPRTPFVARFIGESNFLKGKIVNSAAGYATVARPEGGFFKVLTPAHSPCHSDVHLALRPERVELDGAGENRLPGTVTQLVYRGEMLHVRVALDGGGDITVAARNEGQLRRPVPWRAGDPVSVTWHPDDAHVLEEDPA